MKNNKYIKSPALRQYLEEHGYLNKSTEEVALGKLEYRREYKKRWRMERNRRKKELRLTLTFEEFKILAHYAKKSGINPASYARHAVIQMTKSSITVNRSLLNRILRDVGIGISLLENGSEATEALGILIKAERELTSYLIGQEGNP